MVSSFEHSIVDVVRKNPVAASALLLCEEAVRVRLVVRKVDAAGVCNRQVDIFVIHLNRFAQSGYERDVCILVPVESSTQSTEVIRHSFRVALGSRSVP